MAKEAILYEKLSDNKVRCTACARYCELKEEQIGLCGVRGNQNGKLDLFVYGKVIAGHVDPIEKKPVTHYYPGSKIYSIATTGCQLLPLDVIGFVSIVKIMILVKGEKSKVLT